MAFNEMYSAVPVGGPVGMPLLPIDNTVFNTAYFGVGVSYQVDSNFSINLNYSGLVGQGVTSNAVSGGLTIRF